MSTRRRHNQTPSGPVARPVRRDHANRVRPGVEPLEGRALLATIFVSTANDSNNPNDGEISLREAILISNGTLDVASLGGADKAFVVGSLSAPAPNEIDFAIPAGSPTVLAPTTPLPALTSPVNITGYTQSGAAGNPTDEPDVFLAALPVRIDGYALSQATVGSTVDGLAVVAPNCTISGLNVTGFSGAAVSIAGAGTQGNFLYGNIFGTLPDSTNGRNFSTDPTLSNGVGVKITSSNNRIGGNNPGLRNVVANNGLGVSIGTVGGTGNLVQNNFIIRNATQGVLITSSNNTIGENIQVGGNTISGNGSVGVLITGGPSVQGNGLFSNRIGTDLGVKGGLVAKGLNPLPNGSHGVLILDSPRNVIGNGTDAGRNILAGNLGDGLSIQGSASVGNTVLGNWVGFNIVSGLQSLVIPNNNGISVYSPGNVIGSATAASVNTIDNNRLHGIYLSGAGANSNTIQGNIVGLNPGSGSAFGNAFDGIRLDDAPNNTIGGTASGAGNTVSANNNGVVLSGNGSTGNLIYGNLIGTAADGVTDLGNAVDGVLLVNAPNNAIGGAVTGAGNVISGNNRGVHITGPGSRDNTVQGNFIGTDRTTTSITLHNEIDGVLFDAGASFNSVGGTAAGAGNVIWQNVGSGVRVDNSVSDAVRGNSLFVNHVAGITLSAGNNAQPAPAIASVVPNGSTTHVEGILNAAPLTTFALDFFSSSAKDVSGFGQGQTYITSIPVTTDVNGQASYSYNLPVPVPAGQFVTATATDPQNNTSAFSNAVPAVAVQLQFSAATYAANETDGLVTVTVTRAGGLGGDVSVDYDTSDGTAKAGVDYTAVHGTLFFRPTDFPPGAPQVLTFTVPILDPKKLTGSVAFNINLGNPGNGSTLGSPSASVVTIQDNELPSLQLGSPTYVVAETGGVAQMTVTRNSAVGTTTVAYATADGSAVAGVNYQATSGILTFAPGVTTQTFAVPVIHDNLTRGPLTFTVALGAATNGLAVAPSSATVTVTDTDVPGSFAMATTFTNAPVYAPVAYVIVNRLAGSAGTVSVSYSAGGGNARPGVDYTPVSGILTFAPGEVAKAITIPLLNNTTPGLDYAFAVTLNGPTGGASLAAPAGTAVVIRHPAAAPGPAELVPPTVVEMLPITSGNGVIALAFTFSEPMDPARATNSANFGYFVTGPGADGVIGTYDDTSDPISAIDYDPTLHRSVVAFLTPVPFGVFQRVVLNGNAAPGTGRGLTDLSGNLLDGTGTGAVRSAGTPYTATFAASNKLSYRDAAGDKVTLSVKGPGLISLVRGPDGNAQSVRMINARPGATALTGTVVRPNRFVRSPVVIPAIRGAAGVKVTLRAPFVVGGISASAVDGLANASKVLPTMNSSRLKAWSRGG